jgi:RNA polymerase sigma-70 factor, ECF subfamily
MMQHELPPATYESFFLREFPRLVSVLTARTGDRATAEDLAQDALLQAEQRWHRVVGLDNPAMWVRRVALNRSSNEHRRRGREGRAVVRLGSRLNEACATSGDVSNDDLWDRVRSLPPNQRDAVLLFYVDDMAIADIAEVLGCRSGSVKTHLQRARAALAATLVDPTDRPSIRPGTNDQRTAMSEGEETS